MFYLFLLLLGGGGGGLYFRVSDLVIIVTSQHQGEWDPCQIGSEQIKSILR